MQKDENQPNPHHSDSTTSSTVVSKSAAMPPPFAGSDSSSFPLRRLSNTTALDVDDNPDVVKANGESLDDINGTAVDIERYQQQN